MYPYNFSRQSNKLFSFFKSINLNNLLDGTQKTLGVINQAIPIVHQVSPIIANAKTMFKIADVINSSDNVSSNSYNTNERRNSSTITSNNNAPIFYI